MIGTIITILFCICVLLNYKPKLAFRACIVLLILLGHLLQHLLKEDIKIRDELIDAQIEYINIVDGIIYKHPRMTSGN